MKAILVYDGGDVHIPEEMGMPREDQMQGTPSEQLTELAGRVCYDSLGKGRPSFTNGETEGYHEHIAKVGHGSVLEHFNFTISVPDTIGDLYPLLINRPGVWAAGDGGLVRITMNLRSAVEWSNWGHRTPDYDRRIDDKTARNLLDSINVALNVAAPAIAKSCGTPSGITLKAPIGVSKPVYDEERWASLYLVGSRGFSHEMVRHGDFTAISQRSTRYVDESESPWVEHPLISEFCRDYAKRFANDPEVLANLSDENPVIGMARKQYDRCTKELEAWLLARGVDRTSARKQARGAARGYLGNALQTEMIFSASVAQWKRILRQRACAAADAEIREIACKALGELKRSRYGESFAGFELRQSPDGIGQIAVEV